MTIKNSFVLPWYFISLMDVAQNLIFVTPCFIYSRLLTIPFLKLMILIESGIPLNSAAILS